MTDSRPISSKSAKSSKIYPLEIEEPIKKSGPAEDENRENWSGKLDFFLSALSYSVGLGAVWRFPYLCYKNGGGAFLIPFLIFLLLVGIPLMYLELAVGQFISKGAVVSWMMTPLFKGMGISMNLINNYVNIYYIMIIAYSLYYLFLSLNSELPWAKCNDPWQSPNCVDDFSKDKFNFTDCIADDYSIFKCAVNGKCFANDTSISNIEELCQNKTANLTLLGYYDPIYPSQDYWNKVVLKKSASIDETGDLVWQLVVSLIVAWVVTFLCLFRGVKMSGKIVYFTALFPYLVLFILGIRGWLLPGAGKGLEFYLVPKWEKLGESEVWRDAAVQVFFTLSLSYGGLITLSSYNKFSHNVLRDTFILSISNFLTCILAGLVVFAYIGALSETTGLAVDKVAQTGQGLVYVVFPYAVTQLDVSPLWSVMFFVMMLALGMGTMMASVETLNTSLVDFFPVLGRNGINRALTLAVICAVYFLVDLILCSQAGTYWIELFDTYSANWAILIMAIVECVSVGWIYGLNRFKIDLSAMIPDESVGQKKWFNYAFYWWKFCWLFLTPALLLALAIFSWSDTKAIKVGDLVFPPWTEILGNILSASTLFGIIGVAIYEIVKVRSSGKTWKSLIEPFKLWRPILDENLRKVRDAYTDAGLKYHIAVDESEI